MLPIIVIAGGLATRLRPVTETLPKSLIPVHDVPFVLYQLDLFEKNGFTRVHFCLGYLGNMVEEVIKNSRFDDMDITFSYDGDVLLGTGGAVRKVIDQMTDNFFVTYGDSYLQVDYKAIELYFHENQKDRYTGLMTVFKNEGKWDKSNVVYENGQLVMYSKKKVSPAMNYIDYGVGILGKNNFANYSEGITFDVASIYEELAEKNNLLGFQVYQRFFEVGSFSGINDISNHLKPL